MPGGKWADLAAQSIAHAFVAALATEALLRAWRVQGPADRLALRLAALAQPVLVTPAIFLCLPWRGAEAFHDRFALLVTRRYEGLRGLGIDAFHGGVAVLAASGAALFLMDLVPLVRAQRRHLADAAEVPDRLARAFARAARGLGGRAPRLHFLDLRGPALFCAGVQRPAVVVSRGALDLLDDEELEAALAHEVAHVRRADPALSWALMGARALLFFNPAAQVLARAVARDAEGRADAALRGEGERLALAAALVKLHRASALPPPPRRTLPFAGALAEPLRAARTHALEVRCRALLAPAAAPMPWRALRVTLAASCLGALAVFIA